ncbi:MerR family transcriptional regulator [Roseateles asaccharophilus]|uniref:DNA-binding transcriptional MerR regulator n=1 Tax=Roseateles asaccharophilus TaxID=582607 RepID=A0ABU2A667_9BURK|nr:MerR family transcriptional regulator [Roseateles asaccharophilus]MDR7332689.1 DNA-binding transcriptional MerR regulator [Roseateles asaccharophilus]
MQIGTLSERTGLSRDSLRFYEKRGLLQARRSANGYRDYPEEAVQWLGYVRTAQQLGFTLAEIAADLPLLAQGQDAGPALRDALARKLADVDARIAGLQSLRNELATRLAETPETGASCPLRSAT